MNQWFEPKALKSISNLEESYIKPAVHRWGQFCSLLPLHPRAGGHWQCWETFLALTALAWGAPGIWRVGAWDTAQHLVTHRTALTTENWSG